MSRLSPLITSLSLMLLAGNLKLEAQASVALPLHDDNQRLLQRQEILTGDFGGRHSGLLPAWRSEAAALAADSNALLSDFDRFYLRADNHAMDTALRSKKPVLKYFYRSPNAWLEYRLDTTFHVQVDPIVHVIAGSERLSDGSRGLVFYNRRGAQIRGHLLNRVHFFTDIWETQAHFPEHIMRYVDERSAVPGAGYYKIYDSRLSDKPDDGLDFLLAQGHVGFDLVKGHLGAQLGHGRHFWGDGHRSLYLSDFSNNFFYLQLNTRVGPFQYRNLFAELTRDYVRGPDRVLPKKFLSAHHLSWNLSRNLNIGFFEAIVSGRDNGLELQYFNPLIFYRAVEQGLGSPDNVLIGTNWKWNFLKHFSFYGQFVLDEFVLSELLIKREGWWANKYAFQAGLKYLDVAKIRDLDLQLEYNMSRPYTYSFRDSSANYSHYNQPLAHPLGANFREFIGIINYRPLPRLNLRAQLNYALVGLDEGGSNWGQNIHLGYATFQQEYGNTTAQGLQTRLLIGQFVASYQVLPNLSVDLQAMLRRHDNRLEARHTSFLGLGLRWNAAWLRWDY